MGEELARKKGMRGGHRSSTTRMITRAEEIMAAGDSLDLPRLSQLEVSLKEKLNEIKSLDSKIPALISDEELMMKLLKPTSTRSKSMPP